ncbi:MAG: PIN domain-containing protein [Deltaproteobacteria bacterium]|nr:PIN domain-containing protein [Deltaproteobacteria bacterium]
MKLADSNVWLALTVSTHGFHRASRAWFDGIGAVDQVMFCRATQQSFLRLLTTAEVLAPYGIEPLSNAQAWAAYEGWLDGGSVSFVDEPRGTDLCWKALAVRATASPKLWMDAYLAAFALSGGYQLVTTDRAFKRFKGLRLQVLASS